MDEDLTLLRYHVLCYDVQIRERLVHERGYVIRALQDLRINIAVYEIE